MADPLSIASGTAGLLSLGIQVTQSLVNFYDTYKGQDADVARTAENLESLLGVFRSLNAAVKDRQSQAEENDLLQDVAKVTQKCHGIIQELQHECAKFYKDSASTLIDRIQVTGRRVTYPFRKSTLLKLEEAISDIRDHLSFALDVLHLRDHKTTYDEISELRLLLERIGSTQISSKIRDWLNAPDATINHNAACAKRHAATGTWFVKGREFESWLTDSNSLLWVNGFAGCGKSVLCSTAIQYAFRQKRHEQDVGIAFFYFDFKDMAKQNNLGMLRTLLLQLSGQISDGEKDLGQLYKSYESGSPPSTVLIAYLQRMIKRFRHVYLLLDALDESPRYRERESILTIIQTMRYWDLPGLHLLVTSRDEHDIRESFRTLWHKDIRMKNAEIDEDIASFVSSQLNSLPKFQRWKDRHDEIQLFLTESARGVFRYVECQLNALKRVPNQKHLDRCLHSLPRDLDEMYERILCSIDEDYVDDVRRILILLCYSARPLSVAELLHGHAVDLQESPHLDCDRLMDTDSLLDICTGLVEIVPSGQRKDTTVQIAHYSVQEYLESDRILEQKAVSFALENRPSHAEIARICLVYLLDPKLRDNRLVEQHLTELPLARFAATHWYGHYTRTLGSEDYSDYEKGKSQIEKLVLILFRDPNLFITWIRLHDMDRPWITSATLLRAEYIKASPLYYAALLGFDSILNHILMPYENSASIVDIVSAKSGIHGNALCAASFGGHEKAVQMLLDRGANLHEGGKYGPALHTACFAGHGKVVRTLLDRGADIHAQGGTYGPAIQTASLGGHEDLVQMLLDRGADLYGRGGKEHGLTLHAASYGGHDKVVQLLLDAGVDIDTEAGRFGTALQAALARGHEKVVQMLLDRGADIHAQSGRLGTALQAASSRGHERIVWILLDRNADVNAKSGLFGTALCAASFDGSYGVVKTLLDRGADVQARGGRYGTALQYASREGHEKVVRLLLDRGADVNASGGEYGTALQNALFGEHEAVVQVLLDRGAKGTFD